MLALVILALVGSAIAQNRPGFGVCNGTILWNCQGVFNDALKIDHTLGPQQYIQLTNAIQQKWASDGAAGLLSTCSAFKAYRTCYPDVRDYQNCANNPLGLIVDEHGQATEITKLQAFGYTKIFNQFDFACGAGFSQFANNDACGATVFSAHKAELDACDSRFRDAVAAAPEQACLQASIAKNCVQRVFENACGVPELEWWGCQYERAGTMTNFPQCTQNFCTYNEVQRF